MIGIYIHIPFCRTICPYCDFVRRPLPAGSVPEVFIDALCAEIMSFDGPDAAATVFFGGGTPSLLAPVSLQRVFEALHARFRLCDPEITMEANPDDVEPDLPRAWAALGVNRISLGVQSFDDEVLRYLGRRHDAARARRACDLVARQFDNWSMDLIFGAKPIQAWEETLNLCAALRPTHVSAYGLTYEEGTPFGKRRTEASDEDASLEMYRQARERLQGMEGRAPSCPPLYEHYEISNFARPGYDCRHNLIYWRNEEYAGFGPGAYSFLDGVRARNLIRTDDYLAAPGEKEESLRLSEREIRIETVIQHLRLRSGLPKRVYEERFGTSVHDDFGGALAALIKRRLVEEENGAIRPTATGFELNNEIGLALV